MKFTLYCLIVTSHGAHFPAQPTYDAFPFDECVKGQFDLCFSNSVMMYACFSFKWNTICRMSFISLFNFSILPIVFSKSVLCNILYFVPHLQIHLLKCSFFSWFSNTQPKGMIDDMQDEVSWNCSLQSNRALFLGISIMDIFLLYQIGLLKLAVTISYIKK